MKILENKLAVVSGAGSRIGKAIALLYAPERARVGSLTLNEKGGNETSVRDQCKRK